MWNFSDFKGYRAGKKKQCSHNVSHDPKIEIKEKLLPALDLSCDAIFFTLCIFTDISSKIVLMR